MTNLAYFPLRKTFNVSAEQQIRNHNAHEILKINLSNYLDSIRHLPEALFKLRKNEAHKLIRSKWELVHGDKDL